MRVKHFTEELFLIEDMEALTSAYEEISVMKMQQIRKQVLTTRAFMEDVSRVFYHVKSSYKNQLEQLIKKNKKQAQSLTFSTTPNNGKKIIVLLSANAKLYGDIINRTFDLFAQNLQKDDSDIVVVGLLGKELYEQKGLKKQYTYFQVPDGTVTLEDLKPLINHVAKYQTVEVYYGQFENVVTQSPHASIVSGQQALNENNAEENKPNTEQQFKFFFEPSLETILHFFETQLFSSIFKQTLSEHELARYASRIKAMEEAVDNIHNRKRALSRLQKREKNTLENARQLGALAGVSLWQRKNL